MPIILLSNINSAIAYALVTADLSGFLMCERLFFTTITTITIQTNKPITIAMPTPPITGVGTEEDEDSPVRAEFDITVN